MELLKLVLCPQGAHRTQPSNTGELTTHRGAPRTLKPQATSSDFAQRLAANSKSSLSTKKRFNSKTAFSGLSEP